MLEHLLETLQQAHASSELAGSSNEDLVACLVQSIHRCRFPADSYRALKASSVEDSQPALRRYAGIISELIQEAAGEAGAQTLVSIGCGNGATESILDAMLVGSVGGPGSSPSVRWIGVDRSVPEPGSFFCTSGNGFVSADLQGARAFLDLAGVPGPEQEQSILTASYVYHHLDIEPTVFLQRCAGARRVVLLEELTTRSEWDQWTCRAARIGYDLLSNIAFNPGWAGAFLENASLFRVRYMFREEVASLGARIIDLPGSSPPLSILVF